MSKYWKRVIVVRTNGMRFDNKLHIEFDVPFDDDYTPNTSEIKIYNLTLDSREKIKRGERLTLEAGYEGDTGIILSGEIKNVRTERSGTDRATIIKVVDSHGTTKKNKFKRTYKKSIKSSTIIRQIANEIGLKIKVLDLPNDKTHKKGYTANGKALDTIELLARDCNASFYFSRGYLYIRDIKKGDNTKFTLTSNTGLVGTPEIFTRMYQNKHTRGYTFNALLQHRVSTASILKVHCDTVQGTFRVITGRHVATADSFFTTFEGVA